MPVYEYRCIQCEHQFDLWQEVGSEPPPCPECASQVKKIFHPVRTIFKGSGFYITDTRAESSKSSGSSSNNAENTPAETKSESKSSDAKSESAGESASTPAPAKTEAKTESKPTP